MFNSIKRPSNKLPSNLIKLNWHNLYVIKNVTWRIETWSHDNVTWCHMIMMWHIGHSKICLVEWEVIHQKLCNRSSFHKKGMSLIFNNSTWDNIILIKKTAIKWPSETDDYRKWPGIQIQSKRSKLLKLDEIQSVWSFVQKWTVQVDDRGVF